jgi:formylmethanofuran dehydrogenase subunit E
MEPNFVEDFFDRSNVVRNYKQCQECRKEVDQASERSYGEEVFCPQCFVSQEN